MKKWIFSAVTYVIIVIFAYIVYDSISMKGKVEQKVSDHSAAEDHGTHDNTSNETSDDHHEHKNEENTENQIKIQVQEENGHIMITLKDFLGNPLKNLEINHEKLMHLIVVDEHLDQYYHLHPEEIAAGQFKVKSQLNEGHYKAFVDIKLGDLAYKVDPIPFKVGNPSTIEHNHPSLEVDKNLEKTVDENSVKLSATDLVVGEPVTLSFDVHGVELEPYLGAMGHVVILDEKAQEYLHVHPQNENEPVFETEFSDAGIYKIWAEFKVNGKVTAFPFVVEVK
ncbi:hypothetical protein JOC75_001712 [Metabacillus crassostreae]|uniref:hypothetical protein n=1 Tax=Metabacillus crassostreae TaxID=929098 RepID=UPI00195ECECA|nr:hypothetical protein [Metabacillus crassostreae]MBM7603739.1 hypothetical protein [Metabacillus crassostreae]